MVIRNSPIYDTLRIYLYVGNINVSPKSLTQNRKMKDFNRKQSEYLWITYKNYNEIKWGY